MIAAFRILAGVALFRLKKMEMANMFAAAAIMLALRLSWLDMGIRFGFGILLNLLAYLTNDYCDVDQALGAQLGLAAFLAVIAWTWSPGLLVALTAGAGICWIYSYKLKRIPYVDVLAMISWGVAMPLVGFPLDATLGWILVGQLALFSACFESIQVIRDHDEDVASGIRTTAVRLGVPATKIMLRGFMILSAAYATLLINRWIGLALLASLAIPFKKVNADVFWNRQRVIMGTVWLAMIGWIFWYGSSNGWLATIDADSVIAAMEWLR